MVQIDSGLNACEEPLTLGESTGAAAGSEGNMAAADDITVHSSLEGEETSSSACSLAGQVAAGVGASGMEEGARQQAALATGSPVGHDDRGAAACGQAPSLNAGNEGVDGSSESVVKEVVSLCFQRIVDGN
jgi:hypothetical protein